LPGGRISLLRAPDHAQAGRMRGGAGRDGACRRNYDTLSLRIRRRRYGYEHWGVCGASYFTSDNSGHWIRRRLHIPGKPLPPPQKRKGLVRLNLTKNYWLSVNAITRLACVVESCLGVRDLEFPLFWNRLRLWIRLASSRRSRLTRTDSLPLWAWRDAA
jgi:hypothetical protein